MKAFWSKIGRKKLGFTLPEVIVSFSVLVLVIVSASNVLAVVMRTNADNVNSVVAYGLAQEGLESIRFIRDSNFVLGLDFDGTVQSSPTPIWGEKLFDKLTGRPSNFILINRDNVLKGCTKANLSECLPLSLKEVSGDVAMLSKDPATLVYQNGVALAVEPVEGVPVPAPAPTGEFSFSQTGTGLPAEGGTPTQFHRLIHVQPYKVTATSAGFDGIRISSMVFWNAGGIEKKVVLTSELTDWK